MCGGAQHGQVADPTTTETEVFPDEHPARTEPSHQYAINEFLCRHRCERGIEPRYTDLPDAGRAELLQLAPDGRKPG